MNKDIKVEQLYKLIDEANHQHGENIFSLSWCNRLYSVDKTYCDCTDSIAYDMTIDQCYYFLLGLVEL